MTEHRVASINDLPQGKKLCTSIGERKILLCHTATGIFAVDAMCTHAEESLELGKVKGNRIICPLHGAAFDLASGEALSRPARAPLRTYPVRLDGDNILITLAANS